MRLDLTEDEIKMIISSIEYDLGVEDQSKEKSKLKKYTELIGLLNDQIIINKKYEEEVEESKKLEVQEIWTKIFYNGYFYQLKDMSLAVDIRIPNPKFGPDDRFKGTTKVFCPISADEEGNVDLTPLLHALLMEIKNNPDKEVKAYATGFMRQFHFNPTLLSHPIPQPLLDMYSTPKHEDENKKQ